MHWQNIVEKISPYLVKVETPNGHGTGFLCLANHDKSILGVATAAHVVGHADEWQQPIRLRSFHTGKAALFKEGNRVVRLDWKTDSAVILFPAGELSFPENLIPLLPTEETLPIGVEIGWLGFPAIEPFTPCFFSGSVSARRDDQSAYLIDGVAINGVSGGPVFYSTDADGVRIVGIITAYRANRATGDTLPGLSYAQDVSHFRKVIEDIQRLDEAKNAKEQEKENSEQRDGSNPNPSGN
jgi:hypothetical protein